MALLGNLVGSLIVILGVVVTALAVPDSAWKRRPITAALVIGVAWLVLTAFIYFRAPENAEAVRALASFAEHVASSRLLQITIAFLLGLGIGVVGRHEVARMLENVFRRNRKQQWFSSYSIGDFGDRELVMRARESSERAGEAESRYLAIDDEIQGLLAAQRAVRKGEVDALSALLQPDSVEVTEAKTRIAALGAEVSARRRERATSFAIALADIYEKLQKGKLVARGFLVPLGENLLRLKYLRPDGGS